MKNISLFLLLVIGLSTSTGHSAQIYRWVDENGKVHFSDQPLAKDAQSITVKQQPKMGEGQSVTKNPASAPGFQEKLLDAYSERRKLKQQEQAAQEARQQQIEAHMKECERVRKYLASTEGLRIFDTDENGERVYLSDAEIEADRAKNQADLDKYCR